MLARRLDRGALTSEDLRRGRIKDCVLGCRKEGRLVWSRDRRFVTLRELFQGSGNEVVTRQ